MKEINNKTVPFPAEATQKTINGEPKLPPFQNLPANPQSVQHALALLTQFEHDSKNQSKLATPGNPNPEAAVEELGGIVASFLFRNARVLLETYMVAQTEYYPLVHGVHAVLTRGPFGQRLAQAIVGGFAQVGNEQNNKAAEGEKPNE